MGFEELGIRQWLRWNELVLRRVVAWGVATAFPWAPMFLIVRYVSLPDSAVWVGLSMGLGLSAVLIAWLDRPWRSAPRAEDVTSRGRSFGMRWVLARGRVHWVTTWEPIDESLPVSQDSQVPWARAWALAWALAMVLPAIHAIGLGLSAAQWWFFLQRAGLPIQIAAGVMISWVTMIWLWGRSARSQDVPATRTRLDVTGLAARVPAALLVGPWLPWVGPQHRMWGSLSAWEWLAWLAAHMIALLVMMRWGRRVDPTTVEPAEDSGRVFGRDWVLQEGTMRWVSAPAASIVRARVPAPNVEWRIDGFVLTVGSGSTPWPVGWAFIATQTTALPLNVLVSLPALAIAIVGDSSALQDFNGPKGWLLGTLGVGAMTALALAGIGAVLQRVAGRTGGQVERTGRLLRTPVGTFTLGDPAQTVTLSWGWRGACLVLSNPRERVELWGRHAELAWLAEHVQRVPELGSTEDVPLQLRMPLRDRVRE